MKSLATDLALAIEQELKENGYTRTTKLEIECDCDSISVGGKVTSYYKKQIILELVKRIVKRQVTIKDNVKVSADPILH